MSGWLWWLQVGTASLNVLGGLLVLEITQAQQADWSEWQVLADRWLNVLAIGIGYACLVWNALLSLVVRWRRARQWRAWARRQGRRS